MAGENFFTVAGLLVASIFYLISASLNCSHGWCRDVSAYAVAVGALSTFICVIICVLEYLKKDLPKIGNVIVSGFLLVWWLSGTGVGTFRGPFRGGHGNGYFSAWAALIISCFYFMVCVGTTGKALVGTVSKTQAVLGISFIGSVFYLTAACHTCWGHCSSYYGYSVAVGAIGLLCIIVLIILNKFAEEMFMKVGVFIAGFNLLWWVCGTGITTFVAPFTYIGNGYFSAWITLIAAAYVLGLTLPRFGKTLDGKVSSTKSHATEAKSTMEIDVEKSNKSSEQKTPTGCYWDNDIWTFMFVFIDGLRLGRGDSNPIPPDPAYRASMNWKDCKFRIIELLLKYIDNNKDIYSLLVLSKDAKEIVIKNATKVIINAEQDYSNTRLNALENLEELVILNCYSMNTFAFKLWFTNIMSSFQSIKLLTFKAITSTSFADLSILPTDEKYEGLRFSGFKAFENINCLQYYTNLKHIELKGLKIEGLALSKIESLINLKTLKLTQVSQ
eukprot:Pgem_evm1s1501